MEIGYQINNWTLIELIKYKTKEGWLKTKYNIECKCGYKRQIDPWDFKRSEIDPTYIKLGKQCRKCSEREYWENKSDLLLYKLIYNDYRFQAKKRGYDFKLTLEEAYKLFISNCHYCGDSPQNIKTHNRNKNVSFKYQGIDRVNANGHYTFDNTLPCCSTCNYGKREMGYDEFYKWIEKVYNIGVQRLSRKGVGPSGSKRRPS